MSPAPVNRVCKTVALPPEEIERRKTAPDAVTRAAATKPWDEGSTLRIHFMEGDPGLQQRVFDAACLWLKSSGGPANLAFVRTDDIDASDIRIKFVQGAGSWSYLGTDCAHPDFLGQETMNYGWLTPESTQEEVEGVVLHEFGHALGLIHEHQNPNQKIDWNVEAVVRDLSGPPNNWPRDKIIANVTNTYDPAVIVKSTRVDPESIMMYRVPAAWTDGRFVAEENNRLSELDRKLVSELYP